MTKRKTGVFRGGWLDETVPAKTLRDRICNEGRDIDADPIINEVAYQRGVWKFDKTRRDVEPEVAEWAKLVAAIDIPLELSPSALLGLKAAINRLPLHVRAVLMEYVFEHTDRHWGRILDDSAIGQLDVNALEPILEFLREAPAALARLKGKRGPRWDCGPALVAVTRAIIQHSALTEVRARELAADLLAECGIRVPRAKSQQIERTRKPRGKLPDDAP